MLAKITDSYLGKTILISGGRGYLGSTLTQVLAKIKCKIIILDKSPKNYWLPKNPKAEIYIVKGDISLPKIWESVLPNVDYLFHLAAIEYNRERFDPLRDYQINALSVLHLLEACRYKNLHPKIIFSSSANLFGLVNNLPVNEQQPSKPISLWSVHKLLAENYLYVYNRKYNIPSVSLRLTNIYGPSANPKTNNRVVINQMINNSLLGRPLVLFKNKNCTRDYIYIDDVIKAFLFIGREDKFFNGGYYIIGSGKGLKIAEAWQKIAHVVKKLTHKKTTIKFDKTVEVEPFDKRNFIADVTSFSSLTGWKPQFSFDQGIRRTIVALDKTLKQERRGNKNEKNN